MIKQVIGGAVLAGTVAVAFGWYTHAQTSASKQPAEVPASREVSTSGALRARMAPVLAIAKPHAAAAPVELGETTLVAKDRRAWHLAELVAFDATTEVHAKTSEGADLVITDPEHALVVKRETGDMYVAWLVPNVAANDPRPLADLEAPAARIEGVTELSTSPLVQPHRQPTGPAQITVTIDGKPLTTVTAKVFATLATTRVDHKETRVAAIDLDQAFGRTALVGIEADGAPIAAAAPAPGARPVIFMNKRERFNFEWVDQAGKPLGAKQREVTLVAMRKR